MVGICPEFAIDVDGDAAIHWKVVHCFRVCVRRFRIVLGYAPEGYALFSGMHTLCTVLGYAREGYALFAGTHRKVVHCFRGGNTSYVRLEFVREPRPLPTPPPPVNVPYSDKLPGVTMITPLIVYVIQLACVRVFRNIRGSEFHMTTMLFDLLCTRR